MTPYISIDIETTGLDSQFCQVLEIGAVIENESWSGPVELLPQFHCYVIYDKIYGEPFALAMNAEILRRIANRKNEPNFWFLSPSEVGPALAHFVSQAGFDPKNLLAGGKNIAGFDVPFLEELPGFDKCINFKHRFVDPGMLYWQPEIDDCPPNTKLCMERAGRPGEVKHTAIEDAMEVIHLVRQKYYRTKGNLEIGPVTVRLPHLDHVPISNAPINGYEMRKLARTK